jgi:hypothetical protein
MLADPRGCGGAGPEPISAWTAALKLPQDPKTPRNPSIARIRRMPTEPAASPDPVQKLAVDLLAWDIQNTTCALGLERF